MASAAPAECPFCRISCQDESADNRQTKLFSDDKVFIVEDIAPHSKHHYLVIPREHLPSASQLTSIHNDIVEHMHTTGLDFIKQRVEMESSTFDPNELREGFHFPPLVSVPHLHLHLIYPANEMAWIYRNLVFRHTSFFDRVSVVHNALFQEGSFSISSVKDQKRPRPASSDSSSGSSTDTAGNLKSLETFVQKTIVAYDAKFKDIDKKHEIVDKKIARTENTLRVVHRNLTKSNMRIMNGPTIEMDNGDMRDPRAAFRSILSEGLGFDNASVDAICEKNSLQRCFWQQQRSRAQGGGRGGAAAAAGLENFVIQVRLANDDDVMSILKEKTKERFREFKLGCPKPVGIDRNFTPKDRWDRNRAFEVARALCEKWMGPQKKN